MWRRILQGLCGIMLLAPLGCGQASGDPTRRASYPFVLTAEEITLARALAEHGLPVDALSSGFRDVFIKIDLLPNTYAESIRRLVMVHHYRYPTDDTIFTMVDLQTHEVRQREVYPHYPTALAPGEVDRALELATGDERLRPVLMATPTTLEARPIQYADSHEPLFGHRVVQVLLRRGGTYIVSPLVLVDLTTETVHLE